MADVLSGLMPKAIEVANNRRDAPKELEESLSKINHGRLAIQGALNSEYHVLQVQPLVDVTEALADAYLEARKGKLDYDCCVHSCTLFFSHRASVQAGQWAIGAFTTRLDELQHKVNEELMVLAQQGKVEASLGIRPHRSISRSGTESVLDEDHEHERLQVEFAQDRDQVFRCMSRRSSSEDLVTQQETRLLLAQVTADVMVQESGEVVQSPDVNRQEYFLPDEGWMQYAPTPVTALGVVQEEGEGDWLALAGEADSEEVYLLPHESFSKNGGGWSFVDGETITQAEIIDLFALTIRKKGRRVVKFKSCTARPAILGERVLTKIAGRVTTDVIANESGKVVLAPTVNNEEYFLPDVKFEANWVMPGQELSNATLKKQGWRKYYPKPVARCIYQLKKEDMQELKCRKFMATFGEQFLREGDWLALADDRGCEEIYLMPDEVLCHNGGGWRFVDQDSSSSHTPIECASCATTFLSASSRSTLCPPCRRPRTEIGSVDQDSSSSHTPIKCASCAITFLSASGRSTLCPPCRRPRTEIGYFPSRWHAVQTNLVICATCG